MNHLDAINEYLREVMPISAKLEEEGVELEHDIHKFIHYLKDRGIFSDTFRSHVIKMHNAIDDYTRAKQEADRTPNSDTQHELTRRQEYLLAQMRSLSTSLTNGERVFRQLYEHFQQYGANTKKEAENWKRLLEELEATNQGIKLQRTNLLTPLDNAKITLDLIATAFKAAREECMRKFGEIENTLTGNGTKYTPKQVLDDITNTLIHLENDVFALINKMYTYQKGIGESRHTVELTGKNLQHISAIYATLRQQSI